MKQFILIKQVDVNLVIKIYNHKKNNCIFNEYKDLRTLEGQFSTNKSVHALVTSCTRATINIEDSNPKGEIPHTMLGKILTSNQAQTVCKNALSSIIRLWMVQI